MSAQPTDQIGGSTPKSSLIHSLRGSFSLGSIGGAATQPTPPTSSVPRPLAEEPVQPEQPPVELEHVAEDEAAPSEVIAELTQEPQPQPELEVEPGLEDTLESVAEEQTPELELDSLSSAVPMAVDSMTDTLNPPQVGGGTAKEAPLLSVTVEHPAIDQAGGVQYVENERTPEMPPEVEGFLQKVEDNVDQIPQEIVIADLQTGQQLPRVLATPVIVLPISPKTEEEGKKKSEAHSIRWLIEWSWKMMKVFSGKVVYRDESAES